MAKTQDHLDNFIEKILFLNGCWLWKGALKEKGYGIAYYNGKFFRAHRLSYLLQYGSIPKGIFVLHKCDRRCCVNPTHLFLGTNQDNMRDMKSKNRSHKYTPEERKRISQNVKASLTGCWALGDSFL